MNVVFVYRERQIARGRAVAIPNVGDYVKAADGIYKVKAVMHDYTPNNNGYTIVYLTDASITEVQMLKYT